MSAMAHAKAAALWEPHKKRPAPHRRGRISREDCHKARCAAYGGNK
ncbi:Uncharacterised protein [Amycolatopsis camponoti]|uniref:Uncharacterized protein n=1 Tax=Amycolatopsis camponoti TaxID=2606593 RepID=A0A6I8LNB4_9PSEU|nr:Uncharacterised protein [Amycolatopsis camponoti]